MGRGNDQAQAAATSASNMSGTLAGNAGALYSTLAPSLEATMAAPQGFSPTDMAKMDTATMQTAGGSQAAAQGAGALRAARTGNLGGSDAAMAKAARTGGEIASEGALATQIKNAALKQQQRELATRGLESLYGTNTGASVNALGQVASNINANTDAENASWDWTKGVGAMSGLISAGAQSYAATKKPKGGG